MGWLLPSSLFPGTGEDAEGRAGERGGHSAHPAGPPAQLPACHHLCTLSLCHPQAFWGPSCPPKGVLPGAERSGYHRVQSCIIKLPWLFASETFTVPCSAGKDDCSKPKLGINYTTTLHFFFHKGKLCGKSRAGTSFPTSSPSHGLIGGRLRRRLSLNK